MTRQQRNKRRKWFKQAEAIAMREAAFRHVCKHPELILDTPFLDVIRAASTRPSLVLTGYVIPVHFRPSI